MQNAVGTNVVVPRRRVRSVLDAGVGGNLLFGFFEVMAQMVSRRRVGLAIALWLGLPSYMRRLSQVCRRLRICNQSDLCRFFGYEFDGCWGRILYFDYLPWTRDIRRHIEINELCQRHKTDHVLARRQFWCTIHDREQVLGFIYHGRLAGSGCCYPSSTEFRA